jgi:small-conductance mechanosensitive channel/CRP-like cAMP-binding protein
MAPTIDETLLDATLYAGLVVLLAVLTLLVPRERRKGLVVLPVMALAMLAGLWLLARYGGRFDDRTIYDIVREALLAILAVAVIRSVLDFVTRVLLGRLQVPAIVTDVLLALMLIVYALVRLTVVGVNIAGVVTTSAVITGAIAFSAQEVLGALWAGLALQLDRTLRLGDWVKVDDGPPGEIVNIRWRTTTVRTRWNDMIIVPNAHLIKDKVHVVARGPNQKAKREVKFQVAYEHAPSRVIATVEEALHRAEIPNVAKDHHVNCFALSFDDSGITYAVYFSLDEFWRYRDTHSDVMATVYAALQRAGMPIPFPQRDVHVRQVEAPEEARERDVEARMHALETIGLFAALTPAELRALAEGAGRCLFVQGDRLFTKGESSDSLFVVMRGRLVVYDERDGARNRLAHVDPPGYVGEMGLLTGQPRGATVVVEGDTECLRLDKVAFDKILRSRPEIVEALSQSLVRRQAENQALLQSLGQADRVDGDHGRARELMQRIRRFFALSAQQRPH